MRHSSGGQEKEAKAPPHAARESDGQALADDMAHKLEEQAQLDEELQDLGLRIRDGKRQGQSLQQGIAAARGAVCDRTPARARGGGRAQGGE